MIKKSLGYLWKRPPIFAAALAFLSILVIVLIWWFKTNGFSFYGQCINHFGELSGGNLIEHLFLGFFISFFSSTIFVYFIGWTALLYMVQLAVFLCRKAKKM